MDEFIKEISAQLNQLKTQINSLKKDPEGKKSVIRSVIVRPSLEKDADTAREKNFLKKSEDGNGYVPGPGFKEKEEEALLNKRIEKCLKID